MFLNKMLAALSLWIVMSVAVVAAEPLKVLIIDGQNNHNWRVTTPVMKKALESSGMFKVDVATTGKGEEFKKFSPKFSDYAVVLSNYSGKMWPEATQKAFIDYVSGGGGLVIVHAADNSFGKWEEYNKMIGLGGWGGRNEKSGPYVYFKNGKIVRNTEKGGGGTHGAQHEFKVIIRNSDHPITKGMPPVWLHAKDELYALLRGPAENMTVLATSPSKKSKRQEPMIFTIDYGKGRVFHTPMGHADYSMKCVGFIVTLQRGTEWAATGKVTQKIPDDFPTADKVNVRKL